MESKLSRWCDGLIELGWLFAVIAMPLFFNIHSDRVFEPDKLTLLRSIAVVMTATWLVKFIDLQQWQYRPHLRWRNDSSFWRMPFILIISLLALVYIVSAIFSVTPSVSWAGSYQRLQGTYTTLSYIVIFAVTIATMRTRAQVRRLVTAVIITSIPVAFYGLLQHFGLDPLPWAGNVEERVAGHMGNAIFIAAYLIMAVPLTLARIIASFTNILSDEKLSTADVMRSSIYIFTLAIQLITIYWSGSRGPWLGLGVGLFAFILVVLVGLRNATPDKARFRLQEAGKAILFVLVGTAVAYTVLLMLLRGVTSAGLLPSLAGPMSSFVAFVGAIGLVIVVMFILIAAQRGWRWLWFGWLSMSLLLAGWLVAFNFVRPSHTELPLVGNAAETLVEWRELPRIGRFGRMLEAESGTGRVRTLIWEGALELLLPHDPIQFPDGSEDTFNFLRPVIGYGPESMYVAYNPFYPPELATLEARNASPDRSHNETFDALIITGLAGFLVWQALYLSVFYYGFRWLGVLRTRRDRNLLIGLWIGVGILVAVGFTLWRGAVYIGVALPFGSIIGLVLYLAYYALLAESPDEEVGPESGPFAAERLLVVALVAGVLAHYVEIHFGIAIAASRVHFFLYVALLFVVTYLLPRLENGRVLLPEPTAGRGRRSRTPAPATFDSWWGPVLLHAAMLGLMIGIMGFTFTTYSQPPDLTLEQPSDLSVGDIFRQSFFVNPKRDFSDSPFIYMMVMLTWSLGTLISLSELVKDKQLQVSAAAPLADGRKRLLAAIFALLGVVSIGYRLLLPLPATAGATALLGQSLLWLWGALCLLAAARLYFLSTETERLYAAGIALTGLLFTLPVLLAGGVGFGLLLGGICAVMLYLLWDRSLSSTVLPAAVLGSISLLIGLFYMFFQAFQYRASLFYRFTVTQPETMEQLLQFLVEESAQPANFLTYFYLFVFGLMLVTALIIAMDKKPRLRQAGTGLGYGALALLVIVAALIIYNTNLNIIQADVVFKRGRFYESEATRTQNVNHWDSAIAIYKDALERAPREDFYYLFLGRSYLERSALTTDVDEQRALLNEAEQQLLRAQDINPLNTDHTANLARLNTRRLSLTEDDAERQARLAAAEDYYRDALRLSPQNSVVRNEYARLALGLKNDCDQALAIYEESAEIDPFYAETFFDMAEAYVACAPRQDGTAAQEAYYAEAARAIDSATALRPNHVQTWLRAGQLLQQFGQYEPALRALEQARALDPQQEVIAAWNIDFLQARIYRNLGALSQAEALAQQALANAPADASAQIQLFLAELGQPEPETDTENGESTEFTETVLEGERPLADLDPAARQNYFDAYPDFVIDLDKAYDAIITTEAGVMRFRLLVEEAPIAVNNFVFLAQQGFYDGLTFHRVLEDFMAQGGDPTGTGAGGPGYAFDIETSSGLNFNQAGMLAMANAGPNTNGSQFFVTMTPQPGLNGRYTIFGRLIEGEAVLDAITRRDPEQNPDFAGDEIIRVDIVEISF